ncbi:glycoside hydrolase family 2 protein, partial [Paenibacillus sp.]|uniref:glycoside hydrolase family 2 protein n=1 Tax=Paenibacillus sp. TaxID=58172 RepID=UPI002D306D66
MSSIRNIVTLSGSDWQVRGYWPWVPIKDRSMETGQELIGVTDWIPASVPGGVHVDLYRAGWIENPYYEMNSLACEWVEHRWWVYKKSFPRPAGAFARAELVFLGIDYEAMVYLNGVLLGEHANMYEPARYDVTEAVRAAESLELKVVMKGVPQEMGQIGKTSLTSTQKSRFNYKWDFSTRLVNIGLWDGVELRLYDDARLADAAVATDADIAGDGAADVGRVRLYGRIERHAAPAPLSLRLSCLSPDGGVAAARELTLAPADDAYDCTLLVPEPRLWWPNGYGEQPLYTVRAELFDGDRPLDAWSFRVGIRSLTYRRNEDAPTDSLPYTFVVNGKPIYVRGVNLTPLDHVYGNVSEASYDWYVYLMKRANVNMARIWGGGIVEKPYFYELCDRHGILVWQEFIQSSSGIDNVPSKLPGFLALLRRAATSALLGRRSHVSLAAWSGGNELMSAPNTPSTAEDENLAMLQALVTAYDPQRLFLPTSASGPVEFVTTEKGVSHDVHGGWQYQGNPFHYELYGESDNLFHSEFGMDGVASVKTLRKILHPRHHVATPMREHVVWRHHGEWWGTFDRDTKLFGPLPDMERFARVSQLMQAEGLRFIIEANRRRQFRQSGCIVWQLNEPWPNSSCTNLAEYYGEQKMAYYAMRSAYAPVHASLSYRRIDLASADEFQGEVSLHSNGVAAAVRAVRATVYGEDGREAFAFAFEAECAADRTTTIGVLRFPVSASLGGLVFVKLETVPADDAPADVNWYAFGASRETPYAPILRNTDARLSVAPVGAWRDAARFEGLRFLERTFEVHNDGADPAL